MSPAWRGVVARAAGPQPSRRTQPARRSQVASYHLSNAAAPYVPPPLRACPTDATSRRPGDVLFPVHLDQLKEVRHRQRPNEEAENVCSYGRTSERSLNAPMSSATPATIAKPAISPMIAASVTGGGRRAETEARPRRAPKPPAHPPRTQRLPPRTPPDSPRTPE